MENAKKGKYTYVKVIIWIGIILLTVVSGVYTYKDVVPFTTRDKVFDFAYPEYDGNIVNSCNASNRYMQMVDNDYNNIPDAIRNAFEAKNGQIVVVDNVVTNVTGSLANYGEFVGLYTSKNMTIQIRYYENYDIVVYHEMGHFFSLTYGLIDEEVERIFSEGEEPNALCAYEESDYFKENIKEFYAECFALYMTNGDALMDSCPEMYSVIASDIENAETIIGSISK